MNDLVGSFLTVAQAMRVARTTGGGENNNNHSNNNNNNSGNNDSGTGRGGRNPFRILKVEFENKAEWMDPMKCWYCMRREIDELTSLPTLPSPERQQRTQNRNGNGDRERSSIGGSEGGHGSGGSRAGQSLSESSSSPSQTQRGSEGPAVTGTLEGAGTERD